MAYVSVTPSTDTLDPPVGHTLPSTSYSLLHALGSHGPKTQATGLQNGVRDRLTAQYWQALTPDWSHASASG